MLAIVLGWACYTQHAWEDFFISFRASQNLALGHGLVYQVGERLHTFTSPLHTLMLAGLAWLAGPNQDPTTALWLYRVIGGIALGGTLVLMDSLGRQHRWPKLPWLIAIGLVALDPKTIDFTVSGMETPLVVFFLALHFHALLTSSGWRMLGISWAGLMWTRPDAFVFIGASLLAQLTVGCASWPDRRTLLNRTVRAGALAAVFYAPWLIWAQAYYGSFVPFTVVAKGLDLHNEPLRTFVRRVLLSPREMLLHGNVLDRIFSPPYTRFGSDWGTFFHLGWKLLALPAWLYWLNLWGTRSTRAASLTFFIASLYAANVPFHPWYAPSYALIAALTWAFLFTDLVRFFSRPTGMFFPQRFSLPLVFAVLLLLVQGATSIAMARTMRWQQALNETGQRREIGLWLKARANSNDTVFLECVGYIGYYSGLKMYDFPGLTSREMVAARRRLKTDLYGPLIAELQPKWLVLRPSESAQVRTESPALLPAPDHPDSVYELVRVFDRTRDIAAIPHLYGRHYLEADQCFEVYRRRSNPSGDRVGENRPH